MKLDPSRRLILSAGATLAAAVWLSGCQPAATPASSPKAFNGTDITGATYATALSLPDVDGKMRSLDEFRGKAVFVFFGYTQCPDVCPTTMADLVAAKSSLGADGDKVQGIFISIDPERDTPEILRAYSQALDPTLLALRGDAAQTAAAARAFKIFYAKSPGKTEGSYTMDHTAGAYVFDPQGKVRLFVRYGSGPEKLAADLKLLLGTSAS